MFTEAEWGSVFMLKMEEDRKRIANSTGYDRILEPIRDKHGFYIFYETWEEPLYFPIFDPKVKGFSPHEEDAIADPHRLAVTKEKVA
jgi:hypothetical protein